ncbi:unnamed protein product [Ambrosiozyma monospora]|uniref:Unnamed protein product n=1 Tax=Ambrosiozyma monospora TaxID=43982 RepID=A0ACB5TG74_AMBMO|nr:unnamed protein product [Ambrosiozyma monospora]
MESSAAPHSFLSVSKTGIISQVRTAGNDDTFAVVAIKQLVDEKLKQFVITFKSYDSDDETCKKFVNSIVETMLSVAKGVAIGNNKLKLMVDLGQLEVKQQAIMEDLMRAMIRCESLYECLLGFMIDSGDWYLPKDMKLMEVNPLSRPETEVAYSFNNLRRRLLEDPEFQNEKSPIRDYLPFLLANRLIENIGDELKVIFDRDAPYSYDKTFQKFQRLL